MTFGNSPLFHAAQLSLAELLSVPLEQQQNTLAQSVLLTLQSRPYKPNSNLLITPAHKNSWCPLHSALAIASLARVQGVGATLTYLYLHLSSPNTFCINANICKRCGSTLFAEMTHCLWKRG